MPTAPRLFPPETTRMFGLFITGTDTGVGKTFVTCRLARLLRQFGYSVGLYKPACSGSLPGTTQWTDLDSLSAALENQFPLDWICPQRFRAPLAPPVAASLENRRVDSRLLRSGVDVWRGKVDVLLVEGVGGWLCPLTESETIADLAQDLEFPVLVVAADRLGTINHTLLTLKSVEYYGLPVSAVVVNRTLPEDDGTAAGNRELLRRLTDVSLYGPLPWAGERDTDAAHVDDQIDFHLATYFADRLRSLICTGVGPKMV